jgi:arylsulfatase A-like enzyme
LDFTVAKEPTRYGVEIQFPYRIVNDAIEFITAAAERPFALWISFPLPHDPYQVPFPYFDMFPPSDLPAREVGPEALDRKGFKWRWLERLANRWNPGYDADWRRTRSNYLGMLRMIDDQMDRFIRYLDSSNLLRNTILVYLTDHGDYFCDYGLLRKGAGLPEDLTRIPMIWAGWGIKPQSKQPAFVSTADIMPTLCEAVGVPVPRGVQGRSLWPLLKGEPYPAGEFESVYAEVGFGGINYDASDRIDPEWGHFPSPPGAIPTFDELNPVTQSGNMKMIRKGDWKLTFDMVGNAELYNIRRDPYELTNLYHSREHSSVKAELTTDLLRWVIRTQDDLPQGAYPAKWAARNWYANYR